jgi:hypothetical protein
VLLARVLLLVAAAGALAFAIYSLTTGDSALGVAWLAVGAALGGETYSPARRSKLT